MSVFSFASVIVVAIAGLLVLGLVAGALWLVWKAVKGLFWLLFRVLGFVKSELVDTLHVVGAAVTGAAMLPLVAVNLVIFRLGAVRHYGRAIGDELASVGVGIWKVALGNPLRLVGLGPVVERIERRLPDVVERAPRRKRARRATFDGYDVVGTLPSGGSGAQLFVARPKQSTLKRFLGQGRSLPKEVVIKSFALEAGSTLPQIVRESRALEAASRLGLVCEHQLSDDHFYYVMPYVKGEDLDRVVKTLHGQSSSEGLGDAELALVLGYAIDLLENLQRFHSGGLWHKDVKPANILVANGRVHLVDFGLVTPLASAMTLTTHGTEYYRDPEMVRLALQGVKVHEVDGVRFDVYSAGAVLFSMIENSFPAHGSLSRITRRSPEALRWIAQRAMAEMSARYGTAEQMRADLAALAAARDPFAVRPADLPSFQRASSAAEPAPAAGEPVRPTPRAYEGRPISPMPVGGSSGAPESDVPWRRRSRVPAAVLAAAGLFGLLFLTLGSMAFLGHARAREARVAYLPHPSEVHATQSSGWASRLPERDRRIVELAQGVAEDLGSTGYPPQEWSEEADPEVDPAPGSESSELALDGAPEELDPAVVPAEEGWARMAQELLAAETGTPDELTPSTAIREQAAPARSSPAPAALPQRGRVLVLDEVASSVDPRAIALLRARLAQRGFTVVGQESDGADAADAVELIASARHALGLGRSDEPETEVELQRFLDEASELRALILVSRAEQEGDHLYRVFVRGERAGDER